MIYKLFMWNHKNKFIAVFPEIDSGQITIGDNKEEVKLKATTLARNKLKNIKIKPETKTVEELFEILNTLPSEDLMYAAGIDFDKITLD